MHEHNVRVMTEGNREVRVLFVIPGEEGGSSMIFAKRQAAAIGRVHDVCANLFYLGSRTSPGHLLRSRGAFHRRIAEFRPNLVHALFGTMTAFFCATSTSLPLVITYYGADLNPVDSGTRLRSTTGRLLSQLAALRARGIICVSRELRDRLWWQRSRVTVIPTPVDTDLFYPEPQADARRVLGWPADEPVVLFNAGFDPARKRLDLAQAAVDVARQTGCPTRLFVLEGTIDPQAVPRLMNAADCLLVTSDSEGSPTVIAEALACNLPVVSVDVGDARERLEGVTPSHVVPREPRAIGAALVDVLTRRVRSDGATKAARYSADALAVASVDVYRAALARSGSPW